MTAPRCCARRCGAWCPRSTRAVDFDYAAYTAENLAPLRDSAMRLRLDDGPRMSDAAVFRQDRHHRRRHRRLLDRLSPRQAGLDRRAAARAGQADLRLDLACRRPRRPAAHQRQHHPAARLLGRALRAAGGRDRPGHRLEDERRPAARLQRRALDRGQAAGDDGAQSFGLEMHLLTAEGGAGPVAADGRSTTWSAPRSCRPTARPTRPTSRRRSPRARACAGVTICEGVTVTGIEVEDGRVARRRHRRRARSPARSVVICAGQWTRELGRMAGVNVPLVSVQHQYLITEPIDGRDARPADAARSRPAHLLQGGGRRAGDGRLRAEPDALGRATACPSDFEFQLLDDDWDHFEPHDGAGARPRAGAADGRHQAADQRPGELHARRQLHPRRGARGARTSSSAPASTPSASPPAAAPAWRWPNGSPTASRRYDLWPVDIRRFGRNHLRHATGCAPARSRPTASTTRWPGRTRSTTAAGRCAARRSTSGCKAQGAVLRREARLGAAELVRRPRGEEPQRRLQLRAGRTGSMRSAASTAPCRERGRRCSTRPRSPSSC